MSFQFDWAALTPFLTQKIREAIEAVQPGVNPMLASAIRLIKLDLGTDPPHVAFTKIGTLHMNKQSVSMIVRYNGNAEMEVGLDINMNACGADAITEDSMRHMGLLYSESPMLTTCRFLISAMNLLVKVEITHDDDKVCIRFEEPPKVSLCIDSNLSLLGPIFDAALQRVMRIIRDLYSELPDIIVIDLSEKE